MAEITETAQDVVLEAVESQETGPGHPGWHRQVALTTMVMALLAALGGLLAGMTANEALLSRTQEIVEMNHLVGHRQSMETLKSKHEILTALGVVPDPAEVEMITAFEEEVQVLEADAARDETEALAATNIHMIFAVSVTLLSLGITLGGMAVVVERKWLWTAGLFVGAAGAVGVAIGVLTMIS